jgi:alpha-glucosidase
MKRFASAMIAALFLSLTGAANTQTRSDTPKTSAAEPWWKHAVIYEIYPRSFQDSNGDGIGDLNGITQRLDYLQQLGVDAIWLTPIYPSPQADFGYDISDYTAIDPQYGTMADFDRLMREAGQRHIRVLMDLVLNHTSDRHPWFIESAGSRDNPKRDWYIWRDGRTGADGQPGPPNNWVNRIGQSAWLFDPRTGQYVYHYYAPEQPDLNWRNPKVEAAMFAAAKFWWDCGVDGFRLDAINTLFEDPGLRDEPRTPGTSEYGEPSLSQVYQRNLPETHGVLRDLRRLSDSYPGQRLLVGEIYTQSTAELATWYGTRHDELQLPMDTDVGFVNKLDAATFRRLLDEAEHTLGIGNTPLLVFDNHDRPRSWDRYGDGVHNVAIAKMLAAILLASNSASLIYQGEELGMETVTPTRKEDVRDPRGLAGWPTEKGRDGERTPMQWDTSRNSGFSSAAETWLPMESSYPAKNVAVESKDAQSLWSWYSRLIELKKDTPALLTGRSLFFNYDAQNTLVWMRQPEAGPAILVVCNMSANPVNLDLRKDLAGIVKAGSLFRPLMTSDGQTPTLMSPLTVAPFETIVAELSSR